MLGRVYYGMCRCRLGRRAARLVLHGLRRARVIRGAHIALNALDLDHAAVAELMRLWPRIHWSSADGMMPAEQLLAVYRLAFEWPVAGDVVELGSWTGLTTSYLAAACRARGDGRVFAVDTFQGTREGGTRYASITRYGGTTWPAFQERIRRAGVESLVTPLVGLTAEMAERYTGRPIRYLLIDADHSYDGVREDFEHWSPLVAPGGVIVFHDHDMPEVARFIEREVVPHPGFADQPGLVARNLYGVTRLPPVTAATVPAA